MGGVGSGRPPSIETVVKRQTQQFTPIGDSIFIPNYSGVKPEALRTSPIDITASGSGVGGGHTIQEEGVNLTARDYLNFSGAGVTAYDDGTATVVSITGGTESDPVFMTLSGSLPYVSDTGDTMTGDLIITESSTSATNYNLSLENSSATATSPTGINFRNSAGVVNTARITSNPGSTYTNSNLKVEVADSSKVLQTRLNIDVAGVATLPTAQGSATNTIVATDHTQTLTNKTISLGSNTVSGTLAQFNTALSDGDFVISGGAFHNGFSDYASNRHFLQTDIANVSGSLSTGILKVTTGTGALSSITDSSTNWDTAYTHSQDNTQAHSDYVLNNANDTMAGILSCSGVTILSDNSTADTAYVPMVLYNTDATPPTASNYPIGTLYIQYSA